MTIQIHADFDGGNIELLSLDGGTATLAISKDAMSDFYQWFHFCVSGAAGVPLTLTIINAGGSAYPFGWPGYLARVSTDGEDWTLAETHYDGGKLTISHTPSTDQIWFAYFAPYTSDRHNALLDRIAASTGVSRRTLAVTHDGRAVESLHMGTGPKQVWLYGRQHPGETMAEWWMEGALEWLTSSDPTAQRLRAKATLHIIPNMNPDGSARGHLRTNALGVNLNREWADPNAERSPEVLGVRNAMDATGVHWAMDVHGDEAIPANFIAGFEGIPNWRDETGAKLTAFKAALEAHTPDFQTKLGYPVSKPGKANLSMSTNQLANRFAHLGCVSMTLEMPFKDHDSNADPVRGWSPERCKRLGVDCLIVLESMI